MCLINFQEIQPQNKSQYTSLSASVVSYCTFLHAQAVGKDAKTTFLM